MIETIKRSVWVISEEGKRALSSNPSVIDDDFLMRYEGFREFKTPSNGGQMLLAVTSDNTPQDELEDAFQKINNELISDILNEIIGQTPEFFEALVVKLLVKMGYGGSLTDAGQVVGKTGDEGIDGIIREDKLGVLI